MGIEVVHTICANLSMLGLTNPSRLTYMKNGRIGGQVERAFKMVLQRKVVVEWLVET